MVRYTVPFSFVLLLIRESHSSVMPSLRKTLIVLLTELEFSGDSQVKEESALLLGHLIRSSQKLVEPYVDTILRALLPKLRDSSARVATCVLSALGELARVSGACVFNPQNAVFSHIRQQTRK